MARRPKRQYRRRNSRRNMRNYLKGNVNESLSLGTLAQGALVSDLWDESVNEKSICTSIKCTWSLDNLTGSQGPIEFGVAHSDYSDAEILEVISNTGSWDSGDKISQERAKRLVRKIGVFVSEENAGTIDVRFNDGRSVRTKLNWKLATGDTLRMWALNKGSQLSSTVPVVICEGQANLFQI